MPVTNRVSLVFKEKGKPFFTFGILESQHKMVE